MLISNGVSTVEHKVWVVNIIQNFHLTLIWSIFVIEKLHFTTGLTLACMTVAIHYSIQYSSDSLMTSLLGLLLALLPSGQYNTSDL